MTVKHGALALLTILVAVFTVIAIDNTSAQSGNLLASPGFDGIVNSYGTDSAWSPWHEEDSCKQADNYNYACRPVWSLESNQALVHGGGQSQHIGVYYTPWHGGVMQTVSAPVGALVRLTAIGRARASQEQYPAPSDPGVDSRMHVGIDPNGGGLWYQNVKWSGTINPHDTWQAVSVEATVGASGKVTVFLATNYREFSRTHLDAWWDDTSLTVIVPPSPTPLPTQPPTAVPLAMATPEPTATPVSTTPPTPSTEPTPEPSPTPTYGKVCVFAFNDSNQNGIRDGIEGAVSGVTLVLFDGQQVTDQAKSDTLQGEICFEQVVPGAYQAMQSVPPGRKPTTMDFVHIDVGSGGRIDVLFGSVSTDIEGAADVGSDTPSATEPSESPTDEPAQEFDLWEKLVSISGWLVLLIALALVGAILVLRR